jgi:hypothetical protein
VDTSEGYVGYERMRHTCHKCHRGFYPLDLSLELSMNSRMSRKKERMLARLAARLPYEEAKAVYEELSYQKTGSMTIHRTAQCLGQKVKQSPPEISLESGGGKQHVTADGAMIHIRGEGWKETLVGAVYEVDESREATEIVYATRLGNRPALGEDLYRLAGQPESQASRGMAFVADGANWLDEIKEMQFPFATRIIDQWHAREYLWNLANEFYEQGTGKAQGWAKEKIKLLKKNQQRSLRQSFCTMEPRTKKQRELLSDTRRYFKNHGHQMNYPLYQRKGFHIGSGVAEGACKHVIQSRFKRAGMRWSRTGAENLLALRSLHVNDKWDLLRNYQRN